MSKKKVKFMCTAFRDGFQSVYGARVLTKDFIPAVEAASDAGINYFESGGGARFQSLYFYCNEDAFDMMDAFREAAGPDANLQTLGRGANVVGLDSQPADIIELHAKMFKKHGTTTIRNFDALNDVNNLIHSGKSIVEAGLKHQIVVTMMELPPGCTGAHGADFYEETLRKILDEDIPFDSVCFKDASGTSVPSKVFETIKRAKILLPEDVELQFHTHETAGIGIACYEAALHAGADVIDLSMAPCSGGTCQPDILTMWHALRGTEFDLDIDVDKVMKAEEVFKECMKHYFLPPEATSVEPLIPWSPMPGGALTANTQMLRDNKLMDKFPEIIKEMGDVVKNGGYGTSVTPVSQFYFQQAFNNVMHGPWEKIAEGYGKMVLGYYGKTPVNPSPKVIKLAQEQLGLEPTEKTAVEINNADPSKGIEPARKLLQAEGLEETDENLFIAATCKGKGITFLKGEAKLGIRKVTAPGEQKLEALSSDNGNDFKVTVNGKNYSVQIDDNKTTVNGKVFVTDIQIDKKGKAVVKESSGKEKISVKAQMPGLVLRFVANVGDVVEEGEAVMVLEAMKMEVVVTAPVSGTVCEIIVEQGTQVDGEQVLAYIE